MQGPFQLVLINIIASLVLITGILAFKIFFPKKKINYFYLLLLISFLPIVSIFRKGVYESGDFIIHLYRTIPFYSSLQEGNIIPSWGAPLDGGYGYPVFIFDYFFPAYIISFFHFLGFSFVYSMKFFLASTYIFSGIFFYFWAIKLTKNKFASFAGSIFYLFAPYHFIDQNFRIAAGEIVFFVTFPLLMLGLFNLFQKQTIRNALLVSLAVLAIFLSHPALALFSALVLIPYFVLSLWRVKKRMKVFFYLLCAGIWGTVLSFFVLFAHVYFIHFTHLEQITGQVVLTSIPDLLFTPWRFGFLFQGHFGEFNPIVGYTQIIVILIVLFLLITKKIAEKNKVNIIFWLGIFFLLVFLISPPSGFIWRAFPILGLAQFSYRLSYFVCFAVATIATLLATQFSKKWMVFLVVITVVYTILNWGNRGMITTIDDNWIKSHIPWATTYGGEGFLEVQPKWWDISKQYWPKEVVTVPAEIVQGNGEVKQHFRNSVDHQYIVYAATPMLIKENTSYFPGWRVTLDKRPTKIDYQNKLLPGRMFIQVPKGLHFLEVKYQDVPIFAAIKKISIVGTLLTIVYIGISFLWKNKQQKKKN